VLINYLHPLTARDSTCQQHIDGMWNVAHSYFLQHSRHETFAPGF